LAARYQPRHGAWLNKKRTPRRWPTAQMVPAMAAIIVAGLLVAGASTAIVLRPAGNPSAAPAFDPADIPPADPYAGRGALPGTAARAPLTSDGVAGANASAAVLEAGSCVASYYGGSGRTASGEWFDPTGHTAAHATWPFGAQVRVINDANGQSVVVRVNDRGPSYGDRCLILSSAAFASIADLGAGVADVRYEVLAQA